MSRTPAVAGEARDGGRPRGYGAPSHGPGAPGVIKHAGDLLTHVHLADAFGELFRDLRANGFDGTLTACVFAWEEKARESSLFMRETIGAYATASS